MVYHSNPQGLGSQSLLVNANHQPQGITSAVVENPLLAIYPPIADDTFQSFKFYQINKNQVPTLQTNLPILIQDTLGAGVFLEPSGNDIRVFDSLGNPLDYFTQFVDISTGEFIIWCNMPVIQDSEFIQLTFGKVTATNGENKNAVYDVNYKSVYNFQDDTLDSTSNAQHLTNFDTISVDGKIGKAREFDGMTSTYLIRNPYTGFPLTEITVEFVVKTTGFNDGFVSYATALAFNDFLLTRQTNLQMWIEDEPLITTKTFDDGVFHYCVATWRSSDGQVKLSLDGVNVLTTTHQQGASITAGGSLVLGQDQDSVGGGFSASQAFNGILDEVRISDTVRSDDYATTTSNNILDNDAFWFKTPLLTNGEDNFLVDDQGRRIIAT